MNEKERIAGIMKLAGDIANHANDPEYVRNAAEGLCADLFCDCIGSGEKAYICATERGLAYSMDTEYGSYTMPINIINERLMRVAISAPESSIRIEMKDAEKKTSAITDEPFQNTEQNEQKFDIQSNVHREVKVRQIINDQTEDTKSIDPTQFYQTPQKSYSEYGYDDKQISPADNRNDYEPGLNAVTEETAEERIDEEKTANKKIAPASSIDNEELHFGNESLDTADSSEKAEGTETDKNVSVFVQPDDGHIESAESEEKPQPNSQKENEHDEDSNNAAGADYIATEQTDDTRNESPVFETSADNRTLTNETSEGTKKKGFFPWLGGRDKERPSELSNDRPVRYANITGDADAAPAADAFEFKDDGGEIFKHTHNVKVVLQFNREKVCGTYKVEFWPTWLQVRQNTKTFADCIVRITNEKGEEAIAIIDKNNREWHFKFPNDKYTFKLFGVWEAGLLMTNVVIDNESQFAILDEIIKEEPEKYDINFLKQFRSEEKGQPSYFIVPLRNNNRGERRIPIVGTALDEGTKYILARVNGNTCKYTHNNRERVISGHWEHGKFKINIE